MTLFFTGNLEESISRFAEFADSTQKPVIIACPSYAAVRGLKKILLEHDLSVHYAETITDVSVTKINLALFDVESLANIVDIEKYEFVAMQNVFGETNFTSGKKRANKLEKLRLESNGFTVGEFVVHKRHGIAKFDGLHIITANNIKYDTARLVYKNGDVLYVLIYNINLVTKYGDLPDGCDPESILDKLGSATFETRRKKIKKDLFAIAQKLMETAAKRKQIEASIFDCLDHESEFDSRFPYVLTEDQENAIGDVAKDLASGQVMDRLICGDVGFGKTEVAMRACFLVTHGRIYRGYFGQVCIIVPTTLLARQHYKTFTERFSGLGIKIAELSRNTHDPKRVLTALELGEIDILIATHAGFGDNVMFKNLELLIIDEEQHFGVKQKEKIKQRYPSIHTILLSATPIPRTLQMSLTGIREISVIMTPPFNRILPKTQVIGFDSAVIANAILREKSRNGRTFFIAPRISDLATQEERLRNILPPEVKIDTAHGQLSSQILEEKMLDFYDGKTDVLLTTSIVESGIDISFANTMFIFNADKFGIAALYQLRGRVGRSNIQSYAYLMLSNGGMISDRAESRIRVISSIKHLGEGFSVAASDLDIRGSGNLVGQEQHGQIQGVGTESYEQMLREAAESIKNDVTIEDEEFAPEIKAQIPFFISEDYIPDFGSRLRIYRELASITDLDEIDELTDEISDRFGDMPQEAKNLFFIAKIKIECKILGISKLDAGQKITLEFSQEHFKKQDAILAELTKKDCKIILAGQNAISISYKTSDINEKILNAINFIRAIPSSEISQ